MMFTQRSILDRQIDKNKTEKWIELHLGSDIRFGGLALISTIEL